MTVVFYAVVGVVTNNILNTLFIEWVKTHPYSYEGIIGGGTLIIDKGVAKKDMLKRVQHDGLFSVFLLEYQLRSIYALSICE